MEYWLVGDRSSVGRSSCSLTRGLEAAISKSRPNDGIVGWFLCLVLPGYVDLVLVCMFVLVILGVVSVL
ncbi:hypothetical protein Bca4012_008265 [Brassica carinata]